ncbi:hypothetical protein KsCSTR_33580 [Candidatus Kuenenia stuttgartiensis]|uniref:Uncharacterized protein n=1 Tax=Kuenenia stuttgartiensis TaxID=174633 RepID=Q1Q4D5_KUEST|nr:hypothetical protein KsCSTR_33580 [Candidatus Kuenenia stuttgartiensis]CAJ74878.1 unknown protein [Candidatus Kuenenia stuttgartiensis]
MHLSYLAFHVSYFIFHVSYCCLPVRDRTQRDVLDLFWILCFVIRICFVFRIFYFLLVWFRLCQLMLNLLASFAAMPLSGKHRSSPL